MQSLAIIKPLKIAASVPSAIDATYARLFSPNPKEGYFQQANQFKYFDIDLGSPQIVDSFFIGYHTASGGQYFKIELMDGTGNAASRIGESLVVSSLSPLGFGEPWHTLARLAQPVSGRYFRVVLINENLPAFSVGVFAIGLAWQAQWGTEWGAGRTIEDTGTAERLFGGDFGIDDGVAVGGYQWTFGDLQPSEIQSLYQLVKDRRTTRSILVVEDPEQTAGLNERIHWGLFGKIDAYERLDPLNTKWALSVRDWG